MKNILTLSLLLTACSGSATSSKSPDFKGDDILTISGRFLTAAGEPLASRPVALRNLRRFAYYDPNASYFRDADLWQLLRAFPLFPFYEKSYEKEKVRPNYFIDEVATEEDGTFSFRMRGDQALRDEAGAINIALINDGDSSSSFAKYNFVVKDLSTELDDIRLCELGETRAETATHMNISWPAPGLTVDHYEFRFGDARDNSLLWVTKVDAADTALALPKTIFMDLEIRYAVEIFYRFEDQMQTSCLTPSQTFQIAQPTSNLAALRPVIADGIDFKLSSLTNGRFQDTSYLSAFDAKTLTLDLGSDQLVSTINIHNLQLHAESTGKLTIRAATQANPTDFKSISLEAISPVRFGSYTLPQPGSYARLRISSPTTIETLQEISVQ